jgi:hypothetical protein
MMTQPSKGKTTQYVKYAAKAGSERVITSADFERVGVKDQAGARWDNLNGFKVPTSAFSKEALDIVLRQPGLALVEETDNGTTVQG